MTFITECRIDRRRQRTIALSRRRRRLAQALAEHLHQQRRTFSLPHLPSALLFCKAPLPSSMLALPIGPGDARRHRGRYRQKAPREVI